MEIFLIVIAIVVLFPFLRNFWVAFFHPAYILGNQAAHMNWIVDGREKDGIVKNMRYRRGGLIAVIPFNNPSVILRYNGAEKSFRDFIEVERWIGKVIEKKELETNQRVDKKVGKLTEYDFEHAESDMDLYDFNSVFDNFIKSIEVIKYTSISTSSQKKKWDGILSDLEKRCNYSLRAVMHYHYSKGNYHLDPEKILVPFSYAMYMIVGGLLEYVYDEKNVKKSSHIHSGFGLRMSEVMTKIVREVIDKDFENSYFEFYGEYNNPYFDDDHVNFWEERPDLIPKILSVRKLRPTEDERHFINGYERIEESDIKESGEANLDFTDYAFVKERVLSNPNEDPIQFLKDTKFLYTPICVRFFFKPELISFWDIY